MPADVETMAYRMRSQKDVPWHGLGFPIDHDATPEEMMEASGLNWTVSKRQLWTPASTSNHIVAPGIGKLNVDVMGVPDYFVLVRDSDNKIFGPAGKSYIPTQNARAFDFFKKFASAGHMRMETAGSLQGGKQIFVLASVNKSFVLPGDDRVKCYLLLSSPHIWGKSLVIKFTTIRVVCSNTLTMAMNDEEYGMGFRMPHIYAFDSEVAHDAENSLGIASHMFEDFEEKANKLAKAKVGEDVVVRYVADIFQPEVILEQFGKGFYRKTKMEQCELLTSPNSPKISREDLATTAHEVLVALDQQPGAELLSSKGTMWGAFNAVTYHSDYLAGRGRDAAVYASWFGLKAAQKTRAMDRALQIAETILR